MEDQSTVVKARKELAEKRHYAYKVRAEAAKKIQSWYKRKRIYSSKDSHRMNAVLHDEQLSTYQMQCEREDDYGSDTENNDLTDTVNSEDFINVQTDIVPQEEEQLTSASSDKDRIQTDSSFDDYVNNELAIALAVINQKSFSSLTPSQQERVQKIQRGINPNPELDSVNVRNEDSVPFPQSSFIDQEIELSESTSSFEDEVTIKSSSVSCEQQANFDHKEPQSDGYGLPLSTEQDILLRKVSEQVVSNSCLKLFVVNEEHGLDSSQQDLALRSEQSQHVVNSSLQQAKGEVKHVQTKPTAKNIGKKTNVQQNAFSRIPTKTNGRQHHTITSTAREKANRGNNNGNGNDFRERKKEKQFKNKGKQRKLKQTNKGDEKNIANVEDQATTAPDDTSQRAIRVRDTKEGWRDPLSTREGELEVTDMISKTNVSKILPISEEEASFVTSTSHESNIVQGISSENCLVLKSPSLGAAYDYQYTANVREERSYGISHDEEEISHGMSHDQEQISHGIQSYDQDETSPYEESSSESDANETLHSFDNVMSTPTDKDIPTTLTSQHKQIQTTSEHLNVVPKKYHLLSPIEMTPTEHGGLKKRPSNKGRANTKKKTAHKPGWTQNTDSIAAEMVDTAAQTDSVANGESRSAIPSPIPCLTQPTTSRSAIPSPIPCLTQPTKSRSAIPSPIPCLTQPTTRTERQTYMPAQPLQQLRYRSLHVQKNKKGKQAIRSLQTPALKPPQKKQTCGYLSKYLHTADDRNGHLTTKSAPGYSTSQFTPTSLPSLTDLSLPWYTMNNTAPPSLLGGQSPLHAYRSPLEPIARRRRLSARPFNRHLGRKQQLKPIQQYSPRNTYFNLSLDSANFDGNHQYYGDPLQTQLTTNYYNNFQYGNRRL